jgi:hypothetical protein
MNPRSPWRRALLLIASSLGVVASCGGSPLSSKTEDEARRMVPVPICVQRLPRRPSADQVVALTAAEYWSLLLPGFRSAESKVDLGQPDCSGRLTLGEPGPGGFDAAVVTDRMG